MLLEAKQTKLLHVNREKNNSRNFASTPATSKDFVAVVVTFERNKKAPKYFGQNFGTPKSVKNGQNCRQSRATGRERSPISGGCNTAFPLEESPSWETGSQSSEAKAGSAEVFEGDRHQGRVSDQVEGERFARKNFGERKKFRIEIAPSSNLISVELDFGNAGSTSFR